ncbi:MAG: hypothetical protein ACKOYH_05610 [Cyanobium sp.]
MSPASVFGSTAILLGLIALSPISALACDGPKELRDTTPTSIQQMLPRQGKEVLTFMGYSGVGYESPQAMKRQALDVLVGKDPRQTVINIGATAEGIGAVYELAKQRGFTTIGIVSSLAREQKASLSSCVDIVYFVKDSSWGGKNPSTHQLSPTSTAIVDNSDVFVAIGGGDVARDEVLAARQAGKPVLFFPADMNHQIAREKARKAGISPPPRISADRCTKPCRLNNCRSAFDNTSKAYGSAATPTGPVG